jgi:hypothetical protein
MENTTAAADTTSLPPKRSAFLLVLCILTFVGSGWGIIRSTLDYFEADKAGTVIDSAMSQANSQLSQSGALGDSAKSVISSIVGDVNSGSLKKYALGSLLSNILTLLGALLMFSQRKIGFYSYLLGIILLIVSPLIFMGGLAGGVMMIVSAIFGIAFIIMYAVNLKNMYR